MSISHIENNKGKNFDNKILDQQVFIIRNLFI